MNTDLLMPLVLLAVIALSIGLVRWQSTRSNDLIDQWAATNSLRILQKESRRMFRGPMFWGTSNNQTVYRVTVVDQYGNQRSGWVRCGGWLMGLHSDKITVRWD